MKEPPAKKIRAEAQGFKRDKPSSVQGSLLPGSRQPDAAVAVVVVPVVDAQTLGIEVADVDTVTVRVEILLVSVHVTRN